MESSTLSKAALGRVAALGDLYDARKDDFVGMSIFNQKIPEDALTLTDNQFSDIHLIHSDTFSEKFAKLNISAELQVSALGGLFSLSGSGQYLNDKKSSDRTVKSSLLYNIKTKEESVNIYHKDLKDQGMFALPAIQTGMATHVVVGISWGANTILSCEYHNNDNRDVMEIKGNLSAQLKKMSVEISGKASAEFTEGDNSKDLKFEIHMYGDILPNNEDLPTTFEGALELMKHTPSLVGNSNGGRGKPLSYTLIPLSLLKDYLDFTMQADTIVKSLEEDCLQRVVQLFDRLSAVKQKINDFHQDADDNRFCVKKEDLDKIAKVKEAFDVEETKFRSQLALKLTEVRSGKGNVSDLEDLMKDFKERDHSPDKVDSLFDSWAHVTRKAKLAKSLVSNHAIYIGFGKSLDDEISTNFNSTAVILFFKEDETSSDSNTRKGNRQLFMQELKKKGPEHIYYAVDCDIHPDLWPEIGFSIQVIQNGKIVTKNMLEDQKTTANKAFAKCTMTMKRSTSKPKDRINLVIGCSGRKCKPNVKYEWMCPQCEENIQYAFDGHFYCGCGHGPLEHYEFKCTDDKHGAEFVLHDDNEYFMQLLHVDQLWGIEVNFPDMNPNEHCDGYYTLVSERVNWATDRRVYKEISKDYYMLWKPEGLGWSIGSTSSLEGGQCFYSSGYDTTEPWQAKWRGGVIVKFVGKNEPQTACNQKIEDGPFGGEGGEQFTDIDLQGDLTGIEVSSNLCIDAIRIRKGNDWSNWHGNAGENLQSFLLEPDEKIIELNLTTGIHNNILVVRSVKFYTNKDRKFFAGTLSNITHQSRHHDGFLSFISGSCGTHLNSINFHYAVPSTT